MVSQSYADKAYLLPCWPKDWNVSFKLYTGQKTCIEGHYKNGRLSFDQTGNMEVIKINQK